MKRLKLFQFESEEAVSLPVEYVIIAGILAIFMFFIISQLNSLFIETPTKVAMKNQFDDVGNEIASKLVDLALIAPDNGKARVKLHMPYAVGDYDFRAGFVEKNGEYFLELKSERLGKTEYYPISNIALEVIPEGYTFSLSTTHELTYTAESHLPPTAVALAYPTKAIEGENITFDMTYSTGEGVLRFEWNFGDNSPPEEGKYIPSDPESGIVQHSYSKGNYTAKLTVWDNFGFSDSDSINITVINKTPDPFLYADKFVIPKVAKPDEDVRITLFLRGGGVIQKQRNVSVMHVIDCSGSMDPDYYEYFWGPSYRRYGYTPYSTESGNAVPTKWEGNVTVDSSFQKLRVDAYSTGKDIDLWVKSPDGDFARAQDSISNGERFEVDDPVTGQWEIVVVANYPTGSDNVTVGIFKYTGNWKTVSTYNFDLQADPETSQIDISSIDDLKIEVNTFNGSKELHFWIREPSGSIEGYYSSSSDEYYENSDAEEGTYTVYVVADFPYGSQEFELKTYIAKIDAVKIAAKTFNGFLKNYDKVGVAYFNGTDECLWSIDGTCWWWCYGCLRQAGVVQELTNDTNNANSSIDGLSAYGGTPMGDGIWVAQQELQANASKCTNCTPVIVLLSDGNPTLPTPSSKAIQLAIDNATAAKNTQINGENIVIYTIGFGSDANETLLKQIASSPSYYYFAATAGELRNIYEQIARELKEKAATNITITDVLPANVKLSTPPSGANITYSENKTIIKWDIPAIKINETWTTSFYVKPQNEGVINVYGLSNVTFKPYPFNVTTPLRTIYLPSGEVRIETAESERVELR